MTELYSAVEVGDLARVEAILASSEEGAIDSEEMSDAVFRLALDSGFKKVAWALLKDDRFDPDAENGEPLRQCIRLGYLDLASALLEKGANPNFRCEESSSAMLLALEYEYYDLAQQMIDKGAEVDIRNSRGWTPLIWAAIKGYRKIVDFLIDNGADIHICNNDGWNALTGAFFKSRTDIVNLLTEKGAHFGRKYSEAALLSAFEHGYYDLVRKLVEDGTNVNILDGNGDPLLILAIRRGDRDIVDLLLTYGADANCRAKKGNPALTAALTAKHFDLSFKHR
jgi:ankyrin repeat protein